MVHVVVAQLRFCFAELVSGFGILLMIVVCVWIGFLASGVVLFVAGCFRFLVFGYSFLVFELLFRCWFGCGRCGLGVYVVLGCCLLVCVLLVYCVIWSWCGFACFVACCLLWMTGGLSLIGLAGFYFCLL